MALKKEKYELLYEYKAEITYTCPERGEVTETVTVQRYDGQTVPDKPSI